VSMDIGAQKKVESELQAQRDFARQVMDSMGQGLTITGPDGTFEYINPAYCHMTGYQVENLLGKKPGEITLASDQETLHLAHLARQNGETTTYETRLVSKDGCQKPVMITGTPRWREGEVIGAIAVITDLSEQKQLQETLLRNEQRYRTVADFTYNWEYWLGPDGQYIYVSSACERISGYPRQAFLEDASLVTRIVHPEDRPAIENHFAAVPQGGDKPCQLEFRILTASGEERWIGHTCQPIYAPDGSFLGQRGTHEDITDRKQVEAQLRYLSTHDSLTGLFNRAYFEAEMERLQGGRQYPVSIVMADVDGLKRVNDLFGHAAGDALIVQAARLIQQAFRQEDIVARIGGDEFAVLLPGTGAEAVRACLERLRQLLAVHPPVSASVRLGLSFGEATGESGANLQKVQGQADVRMYAEKAHKYGTGYT
jgi:diguanylate cyclase (GGDEF)-like protein/PAS domain S-box-containing protein